MKQYFRPLLMSLFVCFFSFGFVGNIHAADAAHQHEHHGGGAVAPGLQLNGAERWEMDEHTRTMLAKMEQTFFQADHSTLVGLKGAGVQLDAQLEALINGCTMQGEAHNQLHIFLTDYMPTVKGLVDAKDYDEARDSAIRLKGYLESYKHYFK